MDDREDVERYNLEWVGARIVGMRHEEGGEWVRASDFDRAVAALTNQERLWRAEWEQISATAAALQRDLTAARSDLRKYGGHLEECDRVQPHTLADMLERPPKCTCGFDGAGGGQGAG